MEYTPELLLFFIVGGIAVLSAVSMLLSTNAVHSALFLVLNFACVAFLYLMLEAAFLAMVQLTVYAGAIMVLFMFVIMLLGAEKAGPEERPRFPWLSRVAVVLTTGLLFVAGVGIIYADISATEPEPLTPIVKVINAVPGLEEVDVYLDETALAEGLEYRHISEQEEVEAGDYTVRLVAEAEDLPLVGIEAVSVLDAVNPLLALDEQRELAIGGAADDYTVELFAPVIHLEGGEYLTLVLTRLDDGSIGFIPVNTDVGRTDSQHMVRYQLVNALPGSAPVELADITDVTDEPYVFIENVPFGASSEEVVLRRDTYRYGVYERGQLVGAEAGLGPDDDLTPLTAPPLVETLEIDYEEDTTTLYVLAAPRGGITEGFHPDLLVVTVDNRPAFGGPTSVGQELFTTYMLPFQAVALLLLAAMIGAIVLTRDAIPAPRPRFQRRLANIDNPIANPPVPGLPPGAPTPGVAIGEPSQD